MGLLPARPEATELSVRPSQRIYAHLVDAIVVLLLSGFVLEVFFGKSRENLVGVLPILYAFMWIGYHTILGSYWASGQTVGRCVQGYSIRRDSGRFLSFSDALLRAGTQMLFILFPFMIPVDLIVAWWRRGESLHDRLSRTKLQFDEYESEFRHRVRGVEIAVVVVIVFNIMQLYYETKNPAFGLVIGGTHSPDAFMKEVEEAALSGDPKSQLALGMIYFTGKEIPQNYKEAARWFKLAADQGNARSQYQLALLHSAGLGVSKDFGKAIKLLKAAADGGDALAQDALRKLASVR